MLVRDLADDLLENVLERDEPLHLAVLVDDEREMRLPLEEGIELILHAGRVRYEPGLLQQLLDVDLLGIPIRAAEGDEQVLRMQDADDVLGLALPPGQPR